MLSKFLDSAKKGNPVYISEVDEAFTQLDSEEKYVVYCVLTLFKYDEKRVFEISLPKLNGRTDEEIDFIKDYFRAEIYNILSSLGGKSMTFYVDKSDKTLLDIVEEMNEVFCIDSPRSQRIKYGRAVNVIDRMLGALSPDEALFRFEVADVRDMPTFSEQKSAKQSDMSIFAKAMSGLEGKIICGMDVGGTDIKSVLVIDGKIDSYKEYDWFPAHFTTSRQLVDPICLIIRLFSAKVALEAVNSKSETGQEVYEDIIKALDKKADTDFVLAAVEQAESFLERRPALIDAVGLCFPDVVVRNKVVGGEVYKTRGIRNNPNIDYETDFQQLTDLNLRVAELIKSEGSLRIINDGPMAAFTAAVEQAAAGHPAVDGVFAHTLGTELGTGWVDENGEIPDIPLEVYNFIIDLGSFVEKPYPSDDLRSINNFNTELAGTLQKYCSQSGVFRLAMKYFPQQRPELFQELLDKNYVVRKDDNGQIEYHVPTEPEDMRKAFLEHMMALPERENDEVCDRVWREVGEFLSVTWIETEKILRPKVKSRILFGRLVKNKRCVELMNEGAGKIKDDIQLEISDSSLANSPLMKELEKNPNYTVAQFAQAIGAAYFGNLSLLEAN